MQPMREGAARANELADQLEAICKRFEAGHVPRVQDVQRIRRASIAMKRLAFVSQAIEEFPFSALLSRMTKPEDLLGPVDLQSLREEPNG